MRTLPPLAAIRVFEAAARHGNFSRAADELGMTQAGVSYQMKLLEERIGAPLFARVGRAVVLTPMGQRIAPEVTAAFNGLDNAFAVARRENDAVLAITASNTFASNWLAGRLGAFQVSRPGLAVRLDMGDAIVDLAAGDADVAIRTTREPPPGLVCHFLMRAPIMPLASPGFIAAHAPIETPAQVMALQRLSPDDLWWQRWLDQVAGGLVASPSPPGLRLDSQLLDGNAAMAGQGVAILNPAMWKTQIAAGLLAPLLPTIAFSRSRYWLCYPEHKRNAPKVRAFREWLFAEIARDAIDDPYGIYDPAG